MAASKPRARISRSKNVPLICIRAAPGAGCMGLVQLLKMDACVTGKQTLPKRAQALAKLSRPPLNLNHLHPTPPKYEQERGRAPCLNNIYHWGWTGDMLFDTQKFRWYMEAYAILENLKTGQMLFWDIHARRLGIHYPPCENWQSCFSPNAILHFN